jgi:hypothetical protein
MTSIGGLPPGLAASAARVGGASTVLDEEAVSAFVTEQLSAHPFDGRSVRLAGGADRQPVYPGTPPSSWPVVGHRLDGCSLLLGG